MMKKLKILLLSPHGSGEHYHGTATASHRLYSADPERFDVTLLHGSKEQTPSSLFKEIVCPRPIGTGAWGLIGWILATRKWLRKNAHRFDVLHAVNAYHSAMAPAHYADKKLGLPAVVKIANHNSDLKDKGGWKSMIGLARRRRRMITEVTATVALSKEVFEELTQYGVSSERIFPIPNSANLSRFKTPSPELRSSLRAEYGLKDSKVIVFSGEVGSRKRPHLILEALGIATEKGLDWRCLMVGPMKSEEYGATLRALMNDLGIADRVKMLGFTTEVEKAYQAADITCLPSMNEAMPSAVVEAMAIGMPAVLTRFSSASELVPSDEVGSIVEPDGRAIFEALEHFLECPDRLRAASVAAKERVVRNFDVQSVFNKYEDVFRWMVEHPAN